MKISIIYDLSVFFGDLGTIWKELLESGGHQVTIIEIGMNSMKGYNKRIKSDVNLIMAGMIILKVLNDEGFPEEGNNILWMFDPLYDKSILHYEKVEWFNKIAHNFKKIICMNQDIENHITSLKIKTKTCILPYNIAQQRILDPIPEHLKIIDLVFLASQQSPKRKNFINNLHKRNLNVLSINGGFWKERRSLLLSNTRISLQISQDKYVYFDQYRIFESIAHGCLVVTEPAKDMESLGFINGENIIVGEIEEIPQICEELLYKPGYRSKIIKEAQITLRNHYCSELFLNDLLRFIK
jgi:hypothetical protein